jgi:murein endopeptidase
MFAIALLLSASTLYAEAIGGYSAGCLKNAVALPLEGPGYQVIRTKRLRYYGHPDLIHYLQHLANQTRLAGMPDLYIADLAMMHGGPLPQVIAATRPAWMPTSGSGWLTDPSAAGSRMPPGSGR